MTTVEDRVRAAMDAITGQVEAARSLPLPPPGATARRWRGRPSRQRWRPWLAPVAAAVAVIAVAVALVAVRNSPAGRPAPPAPAGSENGVPTYYVAIPGYSPAMANSVLAGQEANNPPVGASAAVVGNTVTGDRLATVPAPAGWKFVSVTAAGDDRTFVLGAYKTTPPRVPTATNWFLINLTPGAAPLATVRELPISIPADFAPDSTSLSPDGTELALSSAGLAPNGLSVRVYSMATGALLHTWSTDSSQHANLLSWTENGHQLAFQTLTAGSNPPRVSVRLLAASDPGHDLIADSRVAWSMTAPAWLGDPGAARPFGCDGAFATPSVLVSGDGSTLACGASGVFGKPAHLSGATCPAVPAWNDEGVLQYSTATGKLADTLYRGASSCAPTPNPVQLVWISGSGDAALGYIVFQGYGSGSQSLYRFGLFKAGKFTPLPAPPTIAVNPAGTAW